MPVYQEKKRKNIYRHYKPNKNQQLIYFFTASFIYRETPKTWSKNVNLFAGIPNGGDEIELGEVRVVIQTQACVHLKKLMMMVMMMMRIIIVIIIIIIFNVGLDVHRTCTVYYIVYNIWMPFLMSCKVRVGLNFFFELRYLGPVKKLQNGLDKKILQKNSKFFWYL